MSHASTGQHEHLVVGCYIESHESLKEGLRCFVVTEQSVSVHIIPGECWLRTFRAGNTSQSILELSKIHVLVVAVKQLNFGLVYKGYKSQVCGRGQPETSRGMFRQSKHRRSFSHFSTGSAGA